MQIQIDPHTLERALERGADENEIKETLETGFEIPAKYGKFGKAKVFDYNRLRNQRWYEQKRIEIIYLVENKTIITVTVYVFYGKWEG